MGMPYHRWPTRKNPGRIRREIAEAIGWLIFGIGAGAIIFGAIAWSIHA